MTLTMLLANGEWLNPPPAVVQTDDELRVTAASGSDFWRTTLYGFTHDTGHALMARTAREGSLEVDFRLNYDQQYDQAGLLIRDNETTWLKAGVEISDGVPHVGAVVTRSLSDWSLAPVPHWNGQNVTIRASWKDGAVTLRARAHDGGWTTLRVAPYPIGPATLAGVYACAPLRDGLVVSFNGLRYGPPDLDLHANPPT